MIASRSTFLLLTVLCSLASAQGSMIFVDQLTGNDMNDGLSPATAVATVSRGCQLVGGAGTVSIGPGTYSPSAGETFPAQVNGVVSLIGSGSATTVLDGEMVTQVLSLNGDALHLEGMTVQHGNSAIGGGIYVGQPFTLDLIDVHVLSNSASIGGGLHVQQNSRATACTVTDCRFEGNTASIGAAIQYQINTDENASLILTRTIFLANTGSIGGGVQFQDNGTGSNTLEAHSCTFDGNSGSALRFQRNAGLAFGAYTNCFFTGNDTALSAPDATISVVNCTFTANQTALTATSSVATDVASTIFWGNATELSATGAATIRYSVIEGLALGGFADMGANIDVDPMLTVDGHLLTGSPCTDQGDSAAAMAAGLTVDRDGDNRFADHPLVPDGPGGSIDIGCDELEPPPACTTFCGDCDSDGTGPDVLDALSAAQLAAALFTPTLAQTFCCDVDSSGVLSILDALFIAQEAVALPVTLACP